jgi:nitroimidazol reductase NimA-like FMN-containing flavoprotein (pyridoxamine 5'-phosphate oxidase superfamily)
MKGDLNTNQINNLLCSQAIGRLACCDGKYPYIIPMTYTYDGNYIYGQTNEGKKLDIMRTNPNIAFQVDSYLDIYNWQSVIVYGQFEEIKDDEDDYARELLLKKVMPLLTPSIIQHNNNSTTGIAESREDTIPETILFRISINEKTGKFDRQ